MITNMITRIGEADPIVGDWCVNDREMIVWVDACYVASVKK